MLSRRIMLSLVAIILSGCAGYEKGVDSGLGIGAFNTQSKEDKEKEKWFNSFYGTNQCHGGWTVDCPEK